MVRQHRTRKARQLMPNGVESRLHPLIWCLQHMMPADKTVADLARDIGVTPQALYQWIRQCTDDSRLVLPPLRSRQLAQWFGVRPAYFDAEMFEWGWTWE